VAEDRTRQLREEERVVRLFERPVAYYHENRFVLTEDEAWFTPYRRELDWPPFEKVLDAVSDLGVITDSVIVGSYFPPRTGTVGVIGDVFAVRAHRGRRGI
jgi:hypothetical protein